MAKEKLLLYACIIPPLPLLPEDCHPLQLSEALPGVHHPQSVVPPPGSDPTSPQEHMCESGKPALAHFATAPSFSPRLPGYAVAVTPRCTPRGAITTQEVGPVASRKVLLPESYQIVPADKIGVLLVGVSFMAALTSSACPGSVVPIPTLPVSLKNS